MNKEAEKPKRRQIGCMIVAAFVIGVFIAIAIASFIKARNATASNPIIAEMRRKQMEEGRIRQAATNVLSVEAGTENNVSKTHDRAR